MQHAQKSRIAGPTWERQPRRQQALCTEGNTQVESIYDHYTCFIYLYVACPRIGYVKLSYLSPLNASIVNIRLNVLFINGRSYIASAYYSYLSIFLTNVYLILHPYTLVRSVCQGLLMAPHNTARQVRTLSIVRHPELIALYASAPNHVLGL